MSLENADAVAATRTVLLVDDEENILSALKRLLRRDGYRILTAGGGAQGLELLASEPVDVIISDQRMPQMTGVEFLRQVKARYPDTVRMVLSGYTELQSITDAINEGAIYRFLTKPWDDDLLRGHIADAFRSKEMDDENKRLSQELAAANEQLRELLAERERQLQRDEVVLSVVQEILQLLPLPIVGVDADGLIVAANAEADALFGAGLPLLGSFAEERLPAAVVAGLEASQADVVWTQDAQSRRVRFARLAQAGAQGRLIFVLD